MTVSANTARSGLLVVIVVVSIVGFAPIAGGATSGETNAATGPIVQQQGEASFENQTFVEQRGDVAQMTVLFDGTDRATVTLGSPDVNYEVSFTVVDRDGDGEATVQFNTAVAGRENNTSAIAALGEDEIVGFERATGPIPGPLDATTYELELSVDGQTTDDGELVLNDRSTEGLSVWTAPNATQLGDDATLTEDTSRTDQIARGDWAVLAIEVSGIYGYVENAENLENASYGLNVSVIEDPGLNQPERAVNLSNRSVVIDATNDTVFVLFDTDNLTVGSEYNATFTIDDRNPYLESGENESANATFSVVERTYTVANPTRGELELPATSNATVNGTTSVAPGSVVDVQLVVLGEDGFFLNEQAIVTENGTWSTAFDLSNVSAETQLSVNVENGTTNAPGVVVEPQPTETPAEETVTTEETETTETATDETEPSDETTESETDTTETTAEGEVTEDVVETTTADEGTTESALLTAGATGSSVGFVALLVSSMLVALRRR